MNENLFIKKSCIEVVRSYPGLNVCYDENRNVFGKLQIPRGLYLTSSSAGWSIVFSKYRPQDIDIEEYPGMRSCEVVYQSYMAGEYTPHKVQEEVFPIINRLCPSNHYSSKLIKKGIYIDEGTGGGPFIKFGEECVKMINRLACHYVMQIHFPNPIGYLGHGDADTWGEDMLEMIRECAMFAPVSMSDVPKRIMAENIEIFGLDLVVYTMEKTHTFYRCIRNRFDEKMFLHFLLVNEGREFISYFRNID